MNKLWSAAAAVVVLAGSAFGDTVTTVAGQGFSAMPTNATILTNGGNPFWDNPSTKGSGVNSNIGDLLEGIGGFSSSVVGSDAVTGDYAATGGVDPTAFSFVRNTAAYQISLLYANSVSNFGTGPGQIDTTIGLYDVNTAHQWALYGPGSGNAAQPTSTVVTGPTETQAFPGIGNGDTYEAYATLCYAANACATFYSNSTANTGTATSALGWNHFALFQLASGSWVIGFEDNNCPTCTEKLGDYSDLVFEIQTVSSVPEPGTIAFMGLGLAGLGVLGRRRFAKK
jgi:hypothetical protein